jgi:hypothetical protein
MRLHILRGSYKRIRRFHRHAACHKVCLSLTYVITLAAPQRFVTNTRHSTTFQELQRSSHWVLVNKGDHEILTIHVANWFRFSKCCQLCCDKLHFWNVNPASCKFHQWWKWSPADCIHSLMFRKMFTYCTCLGTINGPGPNTWPLLVTKSRRFYNTRSIVSQQERSKR